MKYRFLICVISLCVISLFVDAQEIDGTIVPDMSEDVMGLLDKATQVESSDNLSIVLTEQIGDLNTLTFLSDPQGEINKNIVAIAQYGNQNNGIINQTGNEQLIGVFQKGDQNTVDLSIHGFNIYNTITQVGSKNYVKHDIENGTNITIKKVTNEQIGNENTIVLQSGVLDYSIIEVRQTGNNNNAEIDLTNTGVQIDPYQIIQTGDNFNISIIKSEFYMPMKYK
jgi:hypothetical protein